MAKPKKKKRLPKDVENLTSDEVMRRVFGKQVQKQLKRQAREDDNDSQTEVPTST